MMSDQTAEALREPAHSRRRPDPTRFISQYGILLVFIALFVILSLMSPAFSSPRNLFNILAQTAPVGIAACGAALVIISGGFDLSVGAVFAVGGVVAASTAGLIDPSIAILLGIGTGLILGLINGFIISGFGINSFIATLATGFIFRGLATVVTGGFLISATNAQFRWFGNGRLFGVPLPVYLFAVVAIVASILLAKSRFGRYLYAAGGNAEAARLSGIRVELVRLAAFGISGMTAGFAGVVSAARVSTGQANAGNGIELTVIAAVVVGGISIMGGEGAIWRAVLGVLLIAMIGNGFNLLDIDPFYQSIAQGVIIIIAVAVDSRTGGVVRQAWTRARLRQSARRQLRK